MKTLTSTFHAAASALLLCLAGCGTSQPLPQPIEDRFADYSPEENNLQSLDRITDNSANTYGHPHAGISGQLFFDVSDARGYSNVYVMDNPTGRAQSPLTQGNNINRMPTFCAKTNMLAFSAVQQGAMISDIYMTNATDGRAMRRITNTPNEVEWFPCLSADGSTIVYERINAGGLLKDAQIWKQDLSSERSTLLGNGRMPRLSPDGQWITFVQYTAEGNSSQLMVMDIDGRRLSQLTDAKMGLVECPCFSPDGSKIVFQCLLPEKADRDLWVINRDGTQVMQLTFNKSFDGEPYWASDGYIYFSSDRGHHRGNFQIWRFKHGTATTINTDTSTSTTERRTQSAIHTVARGETISQIASRYGVTVKDIVKWNDLQTVTLREGMQLKVKGE